MGINRKLQHKNTGSRKLAGISLMVVILLAQPAAAHANMPGVHSERTSRAPYFATETSINEGPTAVDDSGPGFTATESQVLLTSNVLANDMDSDGDPLFIDHLDTANTLGLVTPKDGRLDPTFDQDGMVRTNLSNLSKASTEITVQPDGKTILVGHAYRSDTYTDFVVARYNVDGSLDQSFDGDGIVYTHFYYSDNAAAVVYQPDTKILVAGYLSENKLGIARYNSDGSLDLGFGENGKAIPIGVSLQGGTMGLALQADGKIIISSTSYEGGYKILVARFTPDGSLDPTFDEDGVVKTGFGISTWGANSVILPDNKIVVSGVGTDDAGITMGVVLVRLNPDGSHDESFDGDGILFTDMGWMTTSTLGSCIGLQSDNKIVVAGMDNNQFVMLRYNPNGSLDVSFDEDGMVVNNTLLVSFDMLIQPGGRIIAVGRGGTSSGIWRNTAVGYQPDGSLDPSFGNAGFLNIDLPGAQAYGLISVAPGRGGRIVFGFYDYFAAARIFGSGNFTYDPNGKFSFLRVGQQAYDTFNYTVTDGLSTDTATVTVTIQADPEPIFLPIVQNPPKGIYGRITENGNGASGIGVSLRFFNGTAWSTAAETTSGANGYYQFMSVPSLITGQEYYVRYTNSTNPARLAYWQTSLLNSYSQNASIHIGDFDIANVELASPANGATVSLPAQFTWYKRLASPSDSYEFNIEDPSNPGLYFYTNPPLGNVAAYTLSYLPSGFVYGIYYVWYIGIFAPDGGYGLSYWAQYVRFSTGFSQSEETPPQKLPHPALLNSSRELYETGS